MFTNIEKNEIEHIKKNLGRFPYRGVMSDLARDLNRKRQSIRRSVVKNENIDLLVEIKKRGDAKLSMIRAN